MKNTLLLLTALALTLGACIPMGTRPGPGTPASGIDQGGPIPDPPPEQAIPDRGEVPALPPSTHIIVGMCPATGSYAAMGVDTQARKFTFLISGHQATLQQALQRVHAAKVPVVLYTTLTQVRDTETEKNIVFNPCLGLQSGMTRINAKGTEVAQITEDPPPTPKPTGGDFSNLGAFQRLSWKTAFALDTVEHPPVSAVPVQ